jgi:GNAT superfamily N-acetyltransferase
MTVAVRQRQPEDLPALANVLVRVHARDGYPVEGVADSQAWLTPPRELAAWTALLSGTPIGHVSLVKASEDDDAAALWQRSTGGGLDRVAIPLRLFVDPPHRQLGAGKSLMRATYEYATSHGLQLVFDVMLKDQDAIRLYEALGCRWLGTIDHHHSGDLTEPAAVYAAPELQSP